jgi:branched-chain amino acid transport system substrate-binding protein
MDSQRFMERPATPVLSRIYALALVGATFVLLTAITGCRSSSSTTDEIVVGHYASLTGSEATFGQSTDNGIQLAVDEINEAGGVKGKKIRVITYDDKGDNRETGSAVSRLVTSDHVVAVLGEVATGRSLVGAPICQDNGIPMITPSSTNPGVTEVGDMIFRVCFIDPFQAWACAKFAYEHDKVKAKKAAIFTDQASPYSVGLRDEFEKSFTGFGGTIVAKESYQQGDPDFSAQLTAIRAAAPDVIFIPGYYTDVGNIALQARKLGITVPLLGGDGWDSSKLAGIAGKAIEGCFYSNHYSHQDPNPRVQDFIRKYKDDYKETPDGLAALGYDAARILADAIGRSSSLAGTDIAAELAKTKDFDGVTGKISIDNDRNAVKAAVIIEMKDGQPTLVTTIQPEAVAN